LRHQRTCLCNKTLAPPMGQQRNSRSPISLSRENLAPAQRRGCRLESRLEVILDTKPHPKGSQNIHSLYYRLSLHDIQNFALILF
jgi:hypothetical protein